MGARFTLPPVYRRKKTFFGGCDKVWQRPIWREGANLLVRLNAIVNGEGLIVGEHIEVEDKQFRLRVVSARAISAAL